MWEYPADEFCNAKKPAFSEWNTSGPEATCMNFASQYTRLTSIEFTSFQWHTFAFVEQNHGVNFTTLLTDHWFDWGKIEINLVFFAIFKLFSSGRVFWRKEDDDICLLLPISTPTPFSKKINHFNLIQNCKTKANHCSYKTSQYRLSKILNFSFANQIEWQLLPK